MSNALIVPEEAAFYVRGGLSRAISSAQENIKQSDKFLARYNLDPTDPKYIDGSEEVYQELRSQTESIRAYNQQWLREALQAFESLPKALAPYNM